MPPPPIFTGIVKPVPTLATVQPDTDVWAVFEDEYSDNGGFEYDDMSPALPPKDKINDSSVVTGAEEHRQSPEFDGEVAANAVKSVDRQPSTSRKTKSQPFPTREGYAPRVPFEHPNSNYSYDGEEGKGNEMLEPPKPDYLETKKKKRGFSRGSSKSQRSTSTSSSGFVNVNPHAAQTQNRENREGKEGKGTLVGLLENMGLNGSGRTSRNSMKSDEAQLQPSRVGGFGGGVTGFGGRSQSPRFERERDLNRW